MQGLQATQNDLTAHLYRVESCLAEVFAKQAKVDDAYMELKELIGATKTGDTEMLGPESSSQEKKRKVAEGLSAPGVASASSGVGSGAAPSWVAVVGRKPVGGGPSTTVAGGAGPPPGAGRGVRCGRGPREDGRQERVVVKRLPPVMWGALPTMMPELLAHIKDSLLRVQGQNGGDSLHACVGLGGGSAGVVGASQGEPVRGRLRGGLRAGPVDVAAGQGAVAPEILGVAMAGARLSAQPGVKSASMRKCRVGNERHAKIYAKEEVEQLLSGWVEGGRTPRAQRGGARAEWVALVPGAGVWEVGKGGWCERERGLAEDARDPGHRPRALRTPLCTGRGGRLMR